MPRTDDSAAHAANWRTVLVVDAAVGAVVALVGVVLVALANAFVGALVLSAGIAYVGLVGARARRWGRLRRSASR